MVTFYTDINKIKYKGYTLKEVISDLEQEKFSDFSAKVKTSLEDKLRNNPVVKDKGNELKKLQSIKDTFAMIRKEPEVDNKPDVEPVVSVEPDEVPPEA